MGIYAIAFWMPTLLFDSGGLSNIQVGFLSAIPNLAAVVGMFCSRAVPTNEMSGAFILLQQRHWVRLGLASCGAFGHQPLLVDHIPFYSRGGSYASALPLQWNLLTEFSSSSTSACGSHWASQLDRKSGGIISPALIDMR